LYIPNGAQANPGVYICGGDTVYLTVGSYVEVRFISKRVDFYEIQGFGLMIPGNLTRYFKTYYSEGRQLISVLVHIWTLRGSLLVHWTTFSATAYFNQTVVFLYPLLARCVCLCAN
jgi:hypothetical protein